jgi:hypothetical protein
MRRALDSYLDKAIAMKLARLQRHDEGAVEMDKKDELGSEVTSAEDLAKGTEIYNRLSS